MFGLDAAALSALCKILFDGLAILVMIILYIKSNNKRQKEYEEERKQRNKEYEEEKKEARERNQEMHDNYNLMIQEIVQGIYKKHLTPKESKSIALIEKQINDIINVILKETNASRVCIVRYHNGNKDMLGKSFLKMSMTNEVVNLGVAPMMTDFKDVFRSLLVYWCHEIEVNKYCVIDNTDKIKDVDITMYQYLHVRNIEAKYGIGLRDEDNNTIGFICIEYLNKDDFDLEKINQTVTKNFPKIEALVSLDGGVNNEL